MSDSDKSSSEPDKTTSKADKPVPAIPPVNEQPDPTKVAAQLNDPAQQRDPLLQMAKNKFIAKQDYEADTTICPVCQAEFNPGAPVL